MGLGKLDFHRLQAVRRVVPRGDGGGGEGALAEPEHAERHLSSALVVALLELEERKPDEHGGLVGGDLHDAVQIRALVAEVRRVVLSQEHRGLWEFAVVLVQEKGADIDGRVRSVERVDEARLVGEPHVVAGRVVQQLGVLHVAPQLQHLADSRKVALVRAQVAPTEREGHREVGCGPRHVELFLGADHAVEAADERPAEVLRRSWGAPQASLEL
mmetsp:Transcript_80202/g.209166  ORF Transcript_80202/g.209166 Transcript_80202/m.209166 type:complete len:215 (+) Transcript_80202:1036-1680(+)